MANGEKKGPRRILIGTLWKGKQSIATGYITIDAFGTQKRAVILENQKKSSQNSPDYQIWHYPDDKQQSQPQPTGGGFQQPAPQQNPQPANPLPPQQQSQQGFQATDEDIPF